MEPNRAGALGLDRIEIADPAQRLEYVAELAPATASRMRSVKLSITHKSGKCRAELDISEPRETAPHHDIAGWGSLARAR